MMCGLKFTSNKRLASCDGVSYVVVVVVVVVEQGAAS